MFCTGTSTADPAVDADAPLAIAKDIPAIPNAGAALQELSNQRQYHGCSSPTQKAYRSRGRPQVTFLTETNLRTKGSDVRTVAGALVRDIRFPLRVYRQGI